MQQKKYPGKSKACQLNYDFNNLHGKAIERAFLFFFF